MRGRVRPPQARSVTPLTYLVPFFVASWGALSNSKEVDDARP